MPTQLLPTWSNCFAQNRLLTRSTALLWGENASRRLAVHGPWSGRCPPTHPEQAAIVRYLDYADRRIQRYIRAKQKLVTLLEEQKQALIHRAVTGKVDIRTGLPYPAYKPSGVEWLGDMPEHWEVSSAEMSCRSHHRFPGLDEVIRL